MTLRGDDISRLDRNGTRAWWDYNSASNELVLSATDMREETMHKYVELIWEFKPGFMYVYPCALEILARFMRRNGVGSVGANAVLCDTETLYRRQRELIESQLGCKIFDHYGLTERVVDAVECEQHEGYHVNMEYGILELIDKEGEPIGEPGTFGRVVGTGFGSCCMPLLRYSTDDLAVYALGQCSCGRESVLIQEFKGRLREFIVSKSGRLVPLQPVYDTLKPVWAKIRELKFLQEREGELIVQMAIAPSFTEADVARESLDALYERLDADDFCVLVRCVDRIPRTPRGKVGWIKQRLPIRFEDLDWSEMIDTATGHPTVASQG